MDPIDTKAYGVFVQESQGYMKLLHDLVGSVPNIERLKEIRIAAHRLKGGAGFFQLDRIRAIAGDIEDLTQKDPAELVREQTSLKAKLKELSALIDTLPPPKAAT